MSLTSVDIFLSNKGNYFPPQALTSIKSVLDNLSSQELFLLNTIDFKDPKMFLVVSILGGTLGLDRFLIGDLGMGVLKLLTAGLCGILTIIDWFKIGDRVREENLKTFLTLVG